MCILDPITLPINDQTDFSFVNIICEELGIDKVDITLERDFQYFCFKANELFSTPKYTEKYPDTHERVAYIRKDTKINAILPCCNKGDYNNNGEIKLPLFAVSTRFSKCCKSKCCDNN